jgi:tight adherence protein C
MSVNDFYMAVAGIIILAIGAMLMGPNGNSNAAKIKMIQERRRALMNQSSTPQKRKKQETSVNFIRNIAAKLQLVKKNQVGKTEAFLVEAGFRSKDAIYVLAFFNLVLPVVLGAIGLLIMHYNSGKLVTLRSQIFNYLWPIVFTYIGLKMPGMYVSYMRKKRYNNILKALPDVLDLMTICAEAGLSLVAMLERVSRELSIAYPEIAEELSLTSIEIGFLPDRNKALSNLSERCTLRELRGMVSVFIQTEKYGTPIAQALRVLSAEFRQARMLRAEAKAARLPALMTVPMILFILPTLFIIILSPAIVKLMDTMKN